MAHQEALALRRSRELQRGFLSRLSHELRTPLTAIRGYASSLLQPDVTWDGASQQRFMERIAAESARLGRLVDDLLDFSAIESGVLRLQRDWCDIPLVVEAAVACLPPAAAPLTEVTCDADLPVVWADHDRLEQVFVNLLSNAFGHNPAGTRVAISAALGAPGEIVLSVRDDGAGHAARAGRRAVRARPAAAHPDVRGRPRPVHRPRHRDRARRPARAGPAGPRDLLRDPAAGRGARDHPAARGPPDRSRSRCMTMPSGPAPSWSRMTRTSWT